MHPAKIVQYLTLVVLLAAAITLATGLQVTFAAGVETRDHRTNPTGAGTNRSGMTAVDPNVSAVKPTVHKDGKTPNGIVGCVFCTPSNDQPRTTENMKTRDHRTNPTGAGSNRSAVQGPPIQRDEQGRAIIVNNYSPHEHVQLGFDKNGKPIYSDYTISEKIYQRNNKDGSIDKIQEIIDKDGNKTTRILRHSTPIPHQANRGGNCVFGMCW